MGGEKLHLDVFCNNCEGSPPRGRGKAEITGSGHSGRRITPAWAGKSVPARCSVSAVEDYPRVGGEKLLPAYKRPPCPGSPPRGRGKVSSVSMCTRSPGITPAWAGKSCPERLKTASALDHPRVGGEKRQARTYTASCQGSPPRGRGKVEDMRKAGLNPRITPAWAGKSQTESCGITSSGDHPRVGGEKQQRPACRPGNPGSPPRGRGKALNMRLSVFTGRITPAWAGKSQEHKAEIWRQGDHPRVGGEKTKKIP